MDEGEENDTITDARAHKFANIPDYQYKNRYTLDWLVCTYRRNNKVFLGEVLMIQSISIRQCNFSRKKTEARSGHEARFCHFSSSYLVCFLGLFNCPRSSIRNKAGSWDSTGCGHLALNPNYSVLFWIKLQKSHSITPNKQSETHYGDAIFLARVYFGAFCVLHPDCKKVPSIFLDQQFSTTLAESH